VEVFGECANHSRTQLALKGGPIPFDDPTKPAPSSAAVLPELPHCILPLLLGIAIPTFALVFDDRFSALMKLDKEVGEKLPGDSGSINPPLLA